MYELIYIGILAISLISAQKHLAFLLFQWLNVKHRAKVRTLKCQQASKIKFEQFLHSMTSIVGDNISIHPSLYLQDQGKKLYPGR